MRFLVLALVSVALAACHGPTTTARTDTATTIKFDRALHSMEDVKSRAAAHCAAYGKKPALRGIDDESLMVGFASFDCVS